LVEAGWKVVAAHATFVADGDAPAEEQLDPA
jgi:hypothetical protein